MSHQDAGSLVAKIQHVPPVHPPGGSYVREEHGAYNLLALIVERTTGRSLRDAVKRLVFVPLRIRDSGIDDDRESSANNLTAKGRFLNRPVPLIPSHRWLRVTSHIPSAIHDRRMHDSRVPFIVAS